MKKISLTLDSRGGAKTIKPCSIPYPLVALAVGALLLAAVTTVSLADTGNLVNNLTSAALACPGNANAVYADVNGDGVNETLVVFNTIDGEATGDPWGYFYSSCDAHCGGAAPWPKAKLAIWFVDALAPGFVANQPGTWQYKSVGGVRLSVNSNEQVVHGNWADGYRQVAAYTARYRGGSVVDSFLYRTTDPEYPDLGFVHYEFCSASGIMEVYISSDFSENLVSQFVITSGALCAQMSVTVAATDPVAGEPGTSQGTGTFTFSRTGSTAAALTVNFSVAGTAASVSDYNSLGTTVTFAAGSATATKTVSVLDDSLVEGDKTVVLTLAVGAGYTVGNPSSATVTIKDDDSAVNPSGDILLSCSGLPGGDRYDRGFYIPKYPGVSLDSAELQLSAATAGTYVMTLTVRRSTYGGPVLATSTQTISLNGSTTENKPVIFSFPTTPITKDWCYCFILSLVSGPSMNVYYSVAGWTGGCPEVIETEGTTPTLDTFRRYGVNLILRGASTPQTLLSCSGLPGGDRYDRGFYVPDYPGISLNSAQLQLSAATAGTYVMTLTVHSDTYNGPILGISSQTISFNGSTTENQPVTFTFPSCRIPKHSRVCFILSLDSGPSKNVYYSVAGWQGGCTEVVETEGTTAPLDTFRRNGVNLILAGVDNSNPEVRIVVAPKPNGVYLHWNSIQGRTYTLETSGNFGVFNPVQTGIVATPPVNTIGPIIPSNSRQFYRIMLEPTAP